MWCVECQTDVATEVSSDGQSLLCTTCGNEVRKVDVPGLHPETQSARELLERWAREQRSRREAPPGSDAGESPRMPSSPDSKPEVDLPEPAESAERHQESGSFTDGDPQHRNHNRSAADQSSELTQPLGVSSDDSFEATSDAGGVTVEDSSPGDGQAASFSAEESPEAGTPAVRFRVDPAHAGPAGPSGPEPVPVKRPRHLDRAEASPPADNSESEIRPPELPNAVAADDSEVSPQQAEDSEALGSEPSPRPVHRIDDLHAAAPEPHFDMSTIAKKSHPGQAESLWGQLLAYAGVGLLTVGTALVLWGYFGEIERYASTGWLLSTGGQMLLLLGIVTLVAGGMQQTTFEVTERIEHLGGRIIRIEQSTDELLKGPHFGQPSRQRERNHALTDDEAGAA